MATFDKNQIKDYIGRVEDDTAEFIGAEFCGARLIGNISRQHEQGDLDAEYAMLLLKDAHHLMHLAILGHKYVKLARNPSPEIRIMVLAEEQQARKGQLYQ